MISLFVYERLWTVCACVFAHECLWLYVFVSDCVSLSGFLSVYVLQMRLSSDMLHHMKQTLILSYTGYDKDFGIKPTSTPHITL